MHSFASIHQNLIYDSLKKLFTNLTTWVITAIVAGALLGHFAPASAVKMQLLGKYFIEVIKVFINPIIFLTITIGIGSMDSLKKQAGWAPKHYCILK